MRTGNGKKYFWAVIAVAIIALVIAVCISGAEMYKKIQHQYKLLSHPLEYSEFVERYSDEYGVDKYLVYAIIKTESSFDENAVSNVGARGLMQIMEDTFDWVKFRLGDEAQVYDDMFTAEENIRYGAYLIDYLYEKFGNFECAVAAYHAGAGSVDSWLKNPEYSADGKTLDVIPINDTSHYLKKIISAYKIYNELYNGGKNNG